MVPRPDNFAAKGLVITTQSIFGWAPRSGAEGQQVLVRAHRTGSQRVRLYQVINWRRLKNAPK